VVARGAWWDWDDRPEGNAAHIWVRHHVRPHEAEQAMSDRRRVRVPAKPGRTGEPRWGVVGATASGRVLRVIFTVRRVGRRLAYHVVTAHDARARQRGGYPGPAHPPEPPKEDDLD
jgi:uncharacterized DUF497 family protein